MNLPQTCKQDLKQLPIVYKLCMLFTDLAAKRHLHDTCNALRPAGTVRTKLRSWSMISATVSSVARASTCMPAVSFADLLVAPLVKACVAALSWLRRVCKNLNGSVMAAGLPRDCTLSCGAPSSLGTSSRTSALANACKTVQCEFVLQ